MRLLIDRNTTPFASNKPDRSGMPPKKPHHFVSHRDEPLRRKFSHKNDKRVPMKRETEQNRNLDNPQQLFQSNLHISPGCAVPV